MASAPIAKPRSKKCGVCKDECSDLVVLHCLHGSCFSCLGNWRSDIKPDEIVVCKLCNKQCLVENLVRLRPKDPTKVKSGRRRGEMESDLNILLLGETGAGKSTFINAFGMYCQYDSFDAAKVSDFKFIYAIPARVSVYDEENFEERVITEGNDENENLASTGESVTQATRVYELVHENKMIRLIDTPGVNDTRGRKMDEGHINNIMNAVSKFKYLHGICVLLRADQSRLSDGFKYCLQKIFENFHETALQNIVFCFTAGNKCEFLPGKAETLPVLKRFLDSYGHSSRLLRKEKLYCVDNFIVSYVLRLKANVHSDANTVEKCWTKSKEQINKMITYLSSEAPYPTKHVSSFNFAKQMLKVLADPLIQIVSRSIVNVLEIEQRRKELEKLRSRIKPGGAYVKYVKEAFGGVMSTLWFVVNNKKSRDLVCISERCTRFVSGSVERPICHEDCKDTFKRFCSSMDLLSGKCTQCSCMYYDHQRVCYEMKFNTATDAKEFQDILDKIKSEEDLAVILNERIAKMRQTEINLTNEQTMLMRTCTQLSAFVQKGAIVTEFDNDYVSNVLDRQMQRLNEKLKYASDYKAVEIESERLLKALENMKGEYLRRKRKLIQRDFTLEIHQVFDLVDNVYHLPHFGAMIKQAVHDIQAARLAIAEQTITRLVWSPVV